jgi:hypothetical protein
MSTRKFLRVAEFSTRNLDIPTRILLVLYRKFLALVSDKRLKKKTKKRKCQTYKEK